MKQPKNPQTKTVFAKYTCNAVDDAKNLTANTTSDGRFIISCNADCNHYEFFLTDEAAKYLAIQIRRHFRNEEGKEG
jgi:hypothetical protein